MTTRSHSDQPPVSSDPRWMLLCALFVIALCLLALPAIIIGFLMQRVMTRLLSCEQVRSFGGSLVIAAQGYAALGLPEYAHRILDSCSTYILHACSDPMPIIEKLAKRSDWTPRGPRTRKV